MRHVSLLVVVIGGVLSTIPAWAGAILTQDSRSLRVFASATEVGTQTIGPLTDSPAFGAEFDNLLDTGLLMSLPTGETQAQAIAGQTSNLDATPTFSSIAASATADSAVSGIPGSSFVKAESTSDVGFQFSIVSPQAWTIDASIFDEGLSSTAFVRLRELNSVEYLFNLEGTGDLGDSTGGTLPPGEYELTAQALAVAQLAGPSRAAFPTRLARFAFEIVIVPEPATVAWLIGCLIVTLGSRPRTLRR